MKLRLLAGIAAALLLLGCGGTSNGKSVSEKGDPPPYTAKNFSSRTASAWLKLKTAHVDLSIGSGPNRLTGKGVVLNGPSAETSAFRANYKTRGLNFEMRAVKGIIYINYGDLTKHKFIVVDPADTDNELSKLFAPVIESMDLASSVRKFSGAITHVKRSGKPKMLDGVSTTPYAVTIDTDKLKASRLFEVVPKNAIPETLNYIFYMAADDAPRRMIYSGSGAEFIMNLTKVGEPVVIVSPDKSEQIDQSILKNREKTA